MNHQESRILSGKRGDPSNPPIPTEPTLAEAAARMTFVPKFHRSEFLNIKDTVQDVLCWFKSLVVLKDVKHELFLAVEIVNHLNSLLQLDKKYGVNLHVLRRTIGKLSSSLVMVKAKAEENVRVAMEERKNVQKLARMRKERMAAMEEKMERIARWVEEVAASRA